MRPKPLVCILALTILINSIALAQPAQPAPPASPASPAPSSAPAPSSTPEEFAPFGVRLVVPQDWKRLPEIQPQVIGRWAVMKLGSATEAAALITVELQAARGRTAEMFAKEMAGKIKGNVDTEAELAGNKACRITGDLNDGAPGTPGGAGAGAARPKGETKPFEALIARSDQYIYVLMAVGNADSISHSQALADLRGGFEFVPIISPTEYMDPRPESVQIFSRFRIRLLATLRPSPEQRPNMIQLRTMNYRRNRPDLLVTMEIFNVSGGAAGGKAATLEEIGSEIAVRSGAKDPNMTWKEIPAPPGQPRRIVSSTFQIPGKNLPIRLGLVQLSATEVAMINFGLSTPDDFDRVLYQDRCDTMLQSIELLKPGSATAPAISQ